MRKQNKKTTGEKKINKASSQTDEEKKTRNKLAISGMREIGSIRIL